MFNTTQSVHILRDNFASVCCNFDHYSLLVQIIELRRFALCVGQTDRITSVVENFNSKMCVCVCLIIYYIIKLFFITNY